MKILIIEDELFIRAMLKTRIFRLLKEFENVSVESAETFAEGYTKFLGYKPDVIILDLGLEDSSFEETVENLPLLAQESRVIVISAGLTPILIKHSYQCGAYLVLDKLELNLESLRESIIDAYLNV